MCGRVIQSSAPIRLAIVDGLDVRDSRVHNHPPRWNGAPSQEAAGDAAQPPDDAVSLDPLRWGFIPTSARTLREAESRSMPNVRRCARSPDLPVMPICIHRPDTANMPLDAKRMIYGAPLLR